MSRQNEDSDTAQPAPLGKRDHQSREYEKARLARRFESILKHSKALDLALDAEFDGGFTRTAWTRSFDSIEPQDTNKTMVVTGDCSAIINSYVEILRTAVGSHLVGVLPQRHPHAKQAIQALYSDGGISDSQAATLNQLYVLEGRLEHASPDVTADEVFDAVLLLRSALPQLVEAVTDWLLSLIHIS